MLIDFLLMIARLLCRLGVLEEPRLEIDVRPVYTGERVASLILIGYHSARSAETELLKLGYKGALRDGQLLLDRDWWLKRGTQYTLSLTCAPRSAIGVPSLDYMQGTYFGRSKHFKILEERGIIQQVVSVFNPDFGLWVNNLPAQGRFSVRPCLCEEDGRSRARCCSSFQTFLGKLWQKMKPHLPKHSYAAHNADAGPCSHLNVTIGKDDKFKMDIAWVGTQEDGMNRHQAWRTARGIIEIKATALSDQEFREQGLVQLSKYSSTIAKERVAHGSYLADEPLAALVSDGKRIIAAVCTPRAREGNIFYTPIHDLAANSGKMNWTDTGLQLAVWFLHMTEVLSLRATALNSLERVSQAKVFHIKDIHSKKSLKLTACRSLSQSVHEAKMSGGDVICKFSPMMELTDALEAYGDHTFSQVKTEAGSLKVLGNVAHLPAFVSFGVEKSTGCTVLTTKNRGQIVRHLEPSELVRATDHAVTALHILQVKGLYHGDVSPSNLVVDSNGVYSLIDLGLSGQLGRKAPSFCDNLYTASQALIWKNAISTRDDAESLVYTLLSLSGKWLPWTKAAAEENMFEVLTLRWQMMENPEQTLSKIPPPLRRFMTATFTAVLNSKDLDLTKFITQVPDVVNSTSV